MADKNLILKGTAKYYRIGSKSTRVKLVIDDPIIERWIQEDIKESTKGKRPAVQDYLRNKKIEVRLI